MFKKFRIQTLTVACVVAATVTASGMISSTPSFVASLKDFGKTAEYDNTDISVNYVQKDANFYKKAVEQLSPMYPDMEFVAEPQGLTFSSDDIETNDQVKSIITELKAIEPGLYWSVKKGCLGRECPVKISFTLYAKKLTIESQ